MSGYQLRYQLGTNKRPKRVTKAHSILTVLPNDSEGLRQFRSALAAQISVSNWGTREFGAGFDRVHTWHPDSPFITATDYNNDMEYNWNRQHSIPHPLFRCLLTGTEIPAIVPNPDPYLYPNKKRICVDDILPPRVSYPLPPFTAVIGQVTRMKAPITMIPISLQVLTELPDTGHRSTQGRIYRPHDDSPEVIRHFRERAHASGDTPVQPIINLVHHLVHKAQGGTYYAPVEGSVSPQYYIGVDSRAPDRGQPFSEEMRAIVPLSQTQRCKFRSENYEISVIARMARYNIPRCPVDVE